VSASLGVGVIGAGPVTQAIHLPTLATLSGRFTVAHVMDVDPAVAGVVAGRAGARASTTTEELLADHDVDVVVICSPHQFHAEQVAAAAAAGKRGVLCEKPLATTIEDAVRIAEISRGSGMPVVVGAMHVYDPAVAACRHVLATLEAEATAVRVRTFLPANDVMVDLSTDLFPPASPGEPPAQPTAQPPAELERRIGMVRAGVLGLATHDLPLMRSLLPGLDEVVAARSLDPFGYQLAVRSGGSVGELVALMPGDWQPDWTLDAWGPGFELHLAFPPSYVLAGSSVAQLTTSAGVSSWHLPSNGYQAEWLHLADVVEGRAELAVPVQEAVEDMLFALRLADGAEQHLRAAS
jgi:myo-inositol 2-dehydrogenase/D-chiro-inositol 1-dehydrogenase